MFKLMTTNNNRRLLQDIDNIDEKTVDKFVSIKNRRADYAFKKELFMMDVELKLFI